MSADSAGSGRTDHNMTLSVVFGLIADTTWRMFVPVVGLTLTGVWLDARLSTKPWLMFGGIIIGVLVAVMLVKRQINGGIRT